MPSITLHVGGSKRLKGGYQNILDLAQAFEASVENIDEGTPQERVVITCDLSVIKIFRVVVQALQEKYQKSIEFSLE